MADNDSFMNMLNNPVINPPHQAVNNAPITDNTRLRPAPYPQVKEAQRILEEASKDVYLPSETDAAFEYINTMTNSSQLPTTKEELVELGLMTPEEDSLKIQTIDSFLHGEEYNDIKQAFKGIEKDNQKIRVYLIGEITIHVYILTIVQDKQSSTYALVGLKSHLVET
ncbi:hypothetical protein BDB01DRAFT_771471 [Pilobolus umbonatus]|nr:hypothetical protein BDB01DRAFT_771471 [Pilobolus umbonatus]